MESFLIRETLCGRAISIVLRPGNCSGSAGTVKLARERRGGPSLD